jgi:peptidoglycan-associated lipoprotein
MNSMFRLATVTTLTLFLAACSDPPKVTVPASSAAPVTTVAPRGTSSSAGSQPASESRVATVDLSATGSAGKGGSAAHLDPASSLSRERSVYFDFDQFVIRSQDRPVVEAHGKYLAAQRALKVSIEGNADERGSREYNLALGQKRAQAVVQAMKLLGVGDDQLEAVSYGEERPKGIGHDEASWAQNRRADIRYK